MPRKKHYPVQSKVVVGEQVRISVRLAINKFLESEETELEFPSSFTSDERAYIHSFAKDCGLKSKSRGKTSSRFLTVFKRDGSKLLQTDPMFKLGLAARRMIYELWEKCPLSTKERQELMPLTERERGPTNPGDVTCRDQSKTLGRLNNGMPQVPYSSVNAALIPFRQALPIWPMREQIVDIVINNQVTVISGQTGSGKTTQVPQFLVEHYASTNKPCRIICTQPRRISAVAVGERVAAERNEPVGQSVGYQIRLESRVSPKTVLTYCTDGVMLRTLMGGDAGLATVTHVIVDEVHERNRFSDFLLIALKDALVKFKSLHLTLMSATVDTSVFTKYFNDCPVITVPGRQFDVEEYFLEDVLKRTGYLSKQMGHLLTERSNRLVKRAELEKWSKYVPDTHSALADTNQQHKSPTHQNDQTEIDQHKLEAMDEYISVAWMEGTEEAFIQLMKFIVEENVSVDHQHSISSVTPLMVAACRGNINVTVQLLNLGADISIRASNDLTALDWAQKQQHQDIVDMLEVYMTETGLTNAPMLEAGDSQLQEDEKDLLDLYHQSFSDENIDFDLVMALLSQLHTTTEPTGAILIFIAGYEDIVTLRDLIQSDESVFKDLRNYALYTLHSNMQTADQKRVFRPASPGVRKIILATNIAETSITIDDVVYVIDCGKIKEKSFDCMSGVCMLRSTWISQACAKQRRGRAGRTQPGVCFHMFSSVRYASLRPYHTPEILRLPLHELCLHTKLLAPANTQISDFLGRAIEPPSFLVTRNAVALLKTMEALDPWEDLTELGHHLLDLPIEPRLGKILLYSIVLKCLDPVLTIVCCLAYKDPFVLATLPYLRRASQQSRQQLSAGSFSDHMALLRVFQAWQAAKSSSKERDFCEKHFVSSSTLEMIQVTRSHILVQLRASGFVRTKGFSEIKELNVNSENWAVVKAALTAGMYPNLIRVDREHSLLRTEKECRVMFHPSSTIRDASKSAQASMTASNKMTVESLPSDWMLYEELSRNGRFCHARCCTLVSPITVALFAGPSRMALAAIAEADPPYAGEFADSDSEVEETPLTELASLRIDQWVVFRVDAEAAQLGLLLRQKWNALFLRRMRNPEKPWSQMDEQVLRTVVNVLSLEEQALGLTQPAGIGQRPRPMPTDCYQGARREGNEAGNKVSVQGKFQQHGRALAAERSESPVAAESGSTSYYVIKALSARAIDISLGTSMWAFVPKTERTILAQLKTGSQVILLFSAQGSGNFQGYARLIGDRVSRVPTDVSWNDVYGRNVNPPVTIEWMKHGNVPFHVTRHLLNPYNDNQRVQTSRDGQQLEQHIGEQLCTLFNKFPNYSSSHASSFNNSGGQSRNFGGRPIRGGYQFYAPRSNHHK